MFSKKMNKLISRVPVSIKVTAWFTAVIIFLFGISIWYSTFISYSFRR